MDEYATVSGNTIVTRLLPVVFLQLQGVGSWHWLHLGVFIFQGKKIASRVAWTKVAATCGTMALP